MSEQHRNSQIKLLTEKENAMDGGILGIVIAIACLVLVPIIRYVLEVLSLDLATGKMNMAKRQRLYINTIIGVLIVAVGGPILYWFFGFVIDLM